MRFLAALLLVCALAACGTDIYPTEVRFAAGRSGDPMPSSNLSALNAPLRFLSTVHANDLTHWYAEVERQKVERAPVVVTHPPLRPAARSQTSAPTHSGGGCGGWESLIASLWPASQVATACRIMLCESGGNPSARNPSGAIGLFQLLNHGGTTDPTQNATVAYHLWLSSGWAPWVCR